MHEGSCTTVQFLCAQLTQEYICVHCLRGSGHHHQPPHSTLSLPGPGPPTPIPYVKRDCCKKYYYVYMYAWTCTKFKAYSYHFSGKTVRMFPSGDYEFLCRMYGLSGAAG